jgi:hypothetical protein
VTKHNLELLHGSTEWNITTHHAIHQEETVHVSGVREKFSKYDVSTRRAEKTRCKNMEASKVDRTLRASHKTNRCTELLNLLE